MFGNFGSGILFKLFLLIDGFGIVIGMMVFNVFINGLVCVCLMLKLMRSVSSFIFKILINSRCLILIVFFG